MFSVMLADSAPCTTATIDRYNNGEWVFDRKHDGLRAVLVCNKGAIRIWNRSGNEITHQWPEVVAYAASVFPEKQVILDGELVVNDADGRPNFKLTATRGKQTKPAIIKAKAEAHPGNFIAFDILYVDGMDLRKLEYQIRMQYLDAACEAALPTVLESRLFRFNTWDDGHEALAFVLENRLEGLIVKRKKSIYQAGRRSDWVKVKPTKTASCVVTGFEAGEGARAATFGALTLGLVDENKQLVSVGKVGTGFKQNDLLEVQDLLQRRVVGIVVEVEYQEFTQDGSLRFPVYRGLRTDQTIFDCTLDQVRPQAQEATK